MARKGLLTSIISPDAAVADAAARSQYARRGASRTMMLSLDEMSQNSARLLEGEAVVALDPGLVNASPTADRMELDDQDYRDLVAAMRANGQASPILVRPHPTEHGRYMVVFGRRRLKAAAEIGVPVRAVIKPMADEAAVVAQGQENSARADLSFIERALFARQVLDLGHSKETAKAALTVDDSVLSRMLSVVDVIPAVVIRTLGPAKGVGRDRWEELKKAVLAPKNAAAAVDLVESAEIRQVDEAERFNFVLAALLHRSRKKLAPSTTTSWSSSDQAVLAKVGVKGRAVSISLSSKNQPGFGVWLSENLEDLYQAFKKTQKVQTGD
ncbi:MULTISPECIES: plasmid partitioning protein RepB [unclassified Mesorhizobium]|uniref:plasmid partitioning protein RepB n=1 Tax=unclassified Mesorhizobium TaxID=325217 RepID=UPI001127DA10|nr:MULTISPECIES: plasmid partitioning protein RepB [unclassified Mesorhizobium]MBZ9739967.1 plasmid partitioning protein RepB [Mesorhizobium sp. CO1-1-4]MBZ9806139.1 plasmid partitioning protein RepB [Mesorhizobium sp. ES1-6]TPL88542.1 plasmid partitioning protein RepB [Mesorhizobium sp. B2-3-12]